MTVQIDPNALTALLNGNHGAPFQLLGPHREENTLSIRALRPHARTLTLLHRQTGERVEMTRFHSDGFFVGEVNWEVTDYQLEEITHEDYKHTFDDPYAYFDHPLFTEYDLYLFNEGRNLYIYEKMGAHLREVNGVKGVNFALWAPNAYQVSVVGNFNGWDTRLHPLRQHDNSGVWELFVPGLEVGEHYKFNLRSQHNGYHTQKTDPYGFFTEQRPKTASIVVNLDDYTWNDAAWMEKRAASNPLKQPISIYEAHLGSWRRRADNGKDGGAWLTYRELADELVQYLREMNYTHVELLPIAEHPLDLSWGYQVVGYFAVTSRFGTPQDFKYFVDQCHQNGIGVIVDWVPAHFPKDGHGLSYFDGTHLYEHADPRQAEHPDWGTYIFNYGRNEVRNFLISNALFWLKEYHVDGLRVDAVSSMLYLDFGRKQGEWIPNQYGGNENLEAVHFLREVNEVIHAEVPGAVTMAEESTAWPMVSRPTYLGGLGFTFKWNMGWMHDTLSYLQKDPVYRRYHHNNLTFSMMYAFSENFVLSLSHDEVVHGKGSLMGKIAGDWWQKFATLRTLLGYQVTHPGKQLLFMGQEFGQWAEWSEARSLDWHLLELETHRGVQRWSRDLNLLYKTEPALHEVDFEPAGFRWIEPNDVEQSVFSYIRYAEDPSEFLVIVLNFTPVPHYGYRIGVPVAGYYAEVLNSDADMYGGSNFGNFGGLHSEYVSAHGFDQSLNLRLPPLGVLILKLRRLHQLD
ncbi:MAG: 1,4-alpha-glucan branching enzyme [Anaerolineae bacterium]